MSKLTRPTLLSSATSRRAQVQTTLPKSLWRLALTGDEKVSLAEAECVCDEKRFSDFGKWSGYPQPRKTGSKTSQ
jgi:hypothetical protein